MVSNVFIDTFMRDANGEFIKVYLYLLRCEDGNMPVTVSDIADKLNMTENDILRALKYWNSLKVLKVEYDGSTPVSIRRLNCIHHRRKRSHSGYIRQL